MNSYRDLVAWQKAMDLVDQVYVVVLAFPRYEAFGLSAQLRKAVCSVPSNIAEGHGRYSLRDFRHFLRDARASLQEVETQLLIASRQKYMTVNRAEELIEESTVVARLINGLIRHINGRLESPADNSRNPEDDGRPDH